MKVNLMPLLPLLHTLVEERAVERRLPSVRFCSSQASRG
jgi:hypothetical protein